jgi:cytochrome b561
MRTLQSADGSRAPFDLATITLHWLTVTLITFQAATGLTLEFAEGVVPTHPLLDFHRSAGTVVWCVALARVVWRGTFAKFPPFPEWMSNAQKWIATRTEYGLYGLLLLQPLTGLATTLLLGKPFPLLFWTVPALVPRNPDLWEALLSVHRVGAYCLFTIVGGHAGMALLHHYVFRDEVLERMAPWVRPKRPRLVVAGRSAATGVAKS